MSSSAPQPRLMVPRLGSQVRLSATPPTRVTGELVAALEAIRADLEVPTDFRREVETAAERAAAQVRPIGVDLTGIDFVTIDPPGATDLDQALHLEREGDGYLVRYAIADVPAFVTPGGAVDVEARHRGQTLYAPDRRIPLHPPALSENAASLLADQPRPAFVWSFHLDASAAVGDVGLQRARIRSRAQLSYDESQTAIDEGSASESLMLLAEVGPKRVELERARGGASLNRPDEEVDLVNGTVTVVRRKQLPVEDWNAQLSLMTGMAAAAIMLDGGIGILRTMPAPDDDARDNFRARAALLERPWPDDQAYGEYLRGLDATDPRSLAAIHAAASLFRGAGYTAFDGPLPENRIQAAVGAPYAHATAPLRRLVDRFVLVACEALMNSREIPDWLRDALPELPGIMATTGALAGRLDRESLNAIEAALLASRVGETFEGVVLTEREGGGILQLTDPVVTAPVEGDVIAGDVVSAELVTADIATGEVRFRAATTAGVAERS